ncbi:MAG: HAMP domain-containing histidine kinase [Ignavibacteria bacterium]|jgi:signal transduction histidine kinase|nr:HAMP domain-containing histidine kinase [Ignavibacteria bacterium]
MKKEKNKNNLLALHIGNAHSHTDKKTKNNTFSIILAVSVLVVGTILVMIYVYFKANVEKEERATEFAHIANVELNAIAAREVSFVYNKATAIKLSKTGTAEEIMTKVNRGRVKTVSKYSVPFRTKMLFAGVMPNEKGDGNGVYLDKYCNEDSEKKDVPSTHFIDSVLNNSILSEPFPDNENCITFGPVKIIADIDTVYILFAVPLTRTVEFSPPQLRSFMQPSDRVNQRGYFIGAIQLTLLDSTMKLIAADYPDKDIKWALTNEDKYVLGDEAAIDAIASTHILDYPLHNWKVHCVTEMNYTRVFKSYSWMFLILLAIVSPTYIIVNKYFNILQKRTNELILANSTNIQLFSIISHDLRNPITAINNTAEVLSDHHSQMDAIQIEQQTKRLVEMSSNVTALLTNLLNWARINMDEMKYDQQENILNEIVDDVINQIKGQATQKNIEVIFENSDKQLSVYCDFNMIVTVLRNLISNAIKFSPRDSNIIISANEAKDKKVVVISVRDEGVGMEEDIAANIFHSKMTTIGTTGEKGTGLGLQLCEEFIKRHNTMIWVESEVGKGSTFYFSLKTTK